MGGLMLKKGCGVPTTDEQLKEINSNYYSEYEKRQMRFMGALDDLIKFHLEYMGRTGLVELFQRSGLTDEDMIYLGVVDNQDDLNEIKQYIDKKNKEDEEKHNSLKGFAVLD